MIFSTIAQSIINHQFPAQSNVNLDLHSWIDKIIMLMRFTILAHYTFTFFSTLHARPKTFAIVLLALWFFASTSSLRHQRRYSFKCPWMPIISQLLSLENLKPAMLIVAASITLTTLIAEPSFWEALTVHFKAVNLGTLTSLLRLLSWGEIHLRNSP